MASSTVQPVQDIAFILSVKLTIDPNQLPAFWKALRPAYDAVVAEPENRFFLIAQDPNDPSIISFSEGWSKDVDWFTSVQIKKPYYEPYLNVTESMWVKPRQMEFITPVKGYGVFKADGA